LSAPVTSNSNRNTPLAYDIYAFDLFAAPRDRHDFLDWISRTFRHVDGPGGDASRTTPSLAAWHRDMSQGFPGARDPHHHDIDSIHASKNAHYRFTQSAVQASFEWDSSGPALFRAKKAAQMHGVGLFEASGREGTVWMISSRNRWEIVHRADADQRDFG
jgi:hypothetical protein